MKLMSKLEDGNPAAVVVAGYFTTAAVLGTSVAGFSQQDEPVVVESIVAEAEISDVIVSTHTPTPVAVIEPNYQKCPPTARACVDLTARKSWLQRGGNVEYGPVSLNSGQPGWETPHGKFHVMRHVKDEVSYEFNLEPMPWSTYFSPLGIAFHQGDLEEMSHGCIHLTENDARHYFHQLKVTDEVVIF